MVLLWWFQSDPGWKRSRNRYQRISALLSHGRFCTQSGLFEFLMWLLRLVSYYICQYYFIDDHLSECTVRRQQTWGNPGSWGCGGFEMGWLCDKQIRKWKGLHSLIRCREDAGGKLPALPTTQGHLQQPVGPDILQLPRCEKKGKAQQRWPEIVPPCQSTLLKITSGKTVISFHYHLYSLPYHFYIKRT